MDEENTATPPASHAHPCPERKKNRGGVEKGQKKKRKRKR